MKLTKLRPAKSEEQITECGKAFSELETRQRLLVAAEKLFAERGFASVCVRDLVSEAKVNIAAVNYYFGSKENLYLETLRYSFRNSRQALPRLETLLKQAQAAGTKEAAQAGIRRYVEELMNIIFLSGETSCHTDLMGHEMSNPTAALDIVVEEFISPIFKILVALVEQLRPDLAEAREANLAAMSILGQCLNYSLALPITLKLLKKSQMTSGFVKRLSKQISDFSLTALSIPQLTTLEKT
ncbi:MAG: CerR family C-terminal domain-containing protein [Acidobacteria bacterium]|nr:CerR family C-terminal domain-containing protein [Acidobacteriota bacterium]